MVVYSNLSLQELSYVGTPISTTLLNGIFSDSGTFSYLVPDESAYLGTPVSTLVAFGKITLGSTEEVTLTLSPSSNLSYLVNGNPYTEPITVTSGTRLTLTVVPSTGYDFLYWSDGNTSNPRQLVIMSDTTLSASVSILQVTLTLPSSDHVSYLVDDESYLSPVTVDYGTSLVIEAVPDSGYSFTKWSDEDTSNPRTVVMTQSLTLEAVVQEITEQYTLTLTSVDNVSYLVDDGPYTVPITVNAGTVLKVEAVPSVGHAFVEWSDEVTTNPRNITMSSNVTLSASVEEIPIPLTFTAVGGPATIGMYGPTDTTPTKTYIDIKKSTDGVNWEDWDAFRSTVTIQSGESLYVKANALPYNWPEEDEDWLPSHFGVSGYVGAFGSVMSMYKSDPSTTAFDDIPEDYEGYDLGYLFANCEGLLAAPELPATTLAPYCYGFMFSGCTTLASAPELPATTLAEGCYLSMFSGCTTLASAPELPATTLATSCYISMFEGCTSLESAPELPATTLATGCYLSMFSGCTSITSAPTLPATTLATGCYNSMFSGCTSLESAPELPATTLATSCYISMFSGCTSIASASLPNFELFNWDSEKVSGMFADVADVGVITTLGGSEALAAWKEYASLPEGWTLPEEDSYLIITPVSGTATVSMSNVPSGAIVQYSSDGSNWSNLTSSVDITADTYFRATGTFVTDYSNYFKFSIAGTNVNVSGDITSMGEMQSRAYRNMFMDCTTIVDASELVFPSENLSNDCCNYMFYGCTSLTYAPELPATTLASGCYNYMFSGCTSLTSAPSLPATTLASSCYSNMFSGCTSLESAPALPATTLEMNCYSYMFNGCTSLTSAPSLPATTITASGYSNMFKGCTSLTSAPALPATTLSSSCYSSMFEGCTSLESAPSLPATTLASACYENMFKGCTSLYSASLPNYYIGPNDSLKLRYMFSGVRSSGLLTTLGGSSVMNTWMSYTNLPSGWQIVAPS